MNQKKVSDLLYIRSAVESADSKIGFLPGEADEKMAPYIQPLLEKLAELLPNRDIETLQKENRLDSIPLGFLRGLNWNAKCIVADEAQNMISEINQHFSKFNRKPPLNYPWDTACSPCLSA